MKLKTGILIATIAVFASMMLVASGTVANRWVIFATGVGLVTLALAKLSVCFYSRADALWREMKEMPVTDAMWVMFSNGDKARLLYNVCLINAIFNNLGQEREIDTIRYKLLDFINRGSFVRILVPIKVKIKLYNFYKKHEQLIKVMDNDMYPISSKMEEYRKFLGEMEEYIVELSRIMLEPQVCKLLEKMEDGNSVANTFDLSGFQEAMRKTEENRACSVEVQNRTNVKFVGT